MAKYQDYAGHKKGTLEFTHSPRRYFNWNED